MKKCDYCKDEEPLIEYKGCELCKTCVDWFFKHPEKNLPPTNKRCGNFK